MDAEDTPLAVLFAKISGSAARSASQGDGRAAGAVNASHAGLQAAAGKHGGTVVKTVGNEMIACFDSADRALRAASAMQATMRGQPDGLALSIGFTFGRVIRENQDVFGDTVNLAARVVALANPKQVLTTHQAVERLSPFLRSTCRSIYNATIKGKTEKVAVYEVIWQQDTGTTAPSEAMQEAPAPAKLKLSRRDESWEMDDESPELLAGRDPDNGIIVTGDKVSRVHARIFLRQGKFVIADQSANGTFVLMQHRDEIELHREEIKLHREEFVLLGRGSIGLGQSVADMGDDAIAFEIG